MPLVSVFLAAVMTAGCGATPGDPVSGSQSGGTAFAGTWAQREAASGVALVLTLEVKGTNVTGTGTYSGDGGSGKVTETGTISGDTLQLDITFDNGSPAQFSGEVPKASVMSGTLHLGSAKSLTPAAVVTFDKKN